jgi:hypothetical protein
LFFTSKIFDYFELDANGHAWKVDNLRQDMTVAPGVTHKGTRVTLRIDLNTTRSPRMVFELYTDPDSLAVTSNRLRVSLADHSTKFVSRSEAKRLAMGLELYDRVELDFTGVAEVGQGFVDELFRVWASANPRTVLVPIHMSPEVAFMVNRGLG